MDNEIKDILEKLKDICGSQALENDCPFFNEETSNCIFQLVGVKPPYSWATNVKEEK